MAWLMASRAAARVPVVVSVPVTWRSPLKVLGAVPLALSSALFSASMIWSARSFWRNAVNPAKSSRDSSVAYAQTAIFAATASCLVKVRSLSGFCAPSAVTPAPAPDAVVT